MKTLYLDTAYNQVIGICDERGEWLGLQHSSGQRSSISLHQCIHSLCVQNKVSPESIGRVVYLAGPGFYTGLRIGYGVAQIMKLTGVMAQSFYSFDVPKILGRPDYLWITKAYRGDVFVYNSKDRTSKLVNESDFLAQGWTGEIYIHHLAAQDEKMKLKLEHAKSTESLITDNFQIIISSLGQAIEQPLHYFREPEEEFRPNA